MNVLKSAAPLAVSMLMIASLTLATAPSLAQAAEEVSGVKGDSRGPAAAGETSAVTVLEGIEMPTRGISSHRGANSTHPENTLAAFREAIRLGAHQIELDVYLTDHGDLVVIHDPKVDRTTDGSGDIRRMTLQEIKRLDAGRWKHPLFSGERIPTLDEALRIMPHNIWLNVHLKGNRQLGAAVAEKILEHGRAHQAFLAADREAADGARDVLPEILICNMARQSDWDLYVDQTIDRGDAFIQLLRRPGTPEQMRRLKQAGVVVNLCCTDDPDALAALFEAGVDFPLTDDLQRMMNQARELGIQPLQPIYLDHDTP